MAFFERLSDQQLSTWAPRFVLSKCKAGRLISAPGEGDTPNQVYFLYSGTAQMQAHDHSGKPVGLQTLKAGDLFGDWMYTDSAERKGSVFAQENCVLLVLPKSEFMQLLAQVPECAMAYTQALTRQLQNLAYMISGFLSLRANLRVQVLLLQHAKQSKNGLCIPKMPSHQTLASLAHTQREVVAKEFGRLCKLGVIEKNASVVTILKPELLHSESSGKFALSRGTAGD